MQKKLLSTHTRTNLICKQTIKFGSSFAFKIKQRESYIFVCIAILHKFFFIDTPIDSKHFLKSKFPNQFIPKEGRILLIGSLCMKLVFILGQVNHYFKLSYTRYSCTGYKPGGLYLELKKHITL